MEIKIGEYYLCSDPMNLWIEKEYANKKGTMSRKKVAGYCGTYKQLLNSFARNLIRGVEAKNVEELLIKLNAVEEEIKAFGENISQVLSRECHSKANID